MSKHKHRKIIITTYWNLAGMEDQHRKIFTEMRTTLTENEKDSKVFDPYDEVSQYLAAMVDTMGGEGSPSVANSLTGNETLEEILRTAIGLEKDKENNSLIIIQWNI